MNPAPKEMIKIERGVKLVYHSWACMPLMEDGRVAGATFESKEGRMAIRAELPYRDRMREEKRIDGIELTGEVRKLRSSFIHGIKTLPVKLTPQ